MVWIPYIREFAPETPLRPHPTILLDVKTSRQAKAHQRELVPDAEQFDTVKPEQLLERVLDIATNPNDLVLDSFLGSGTTAAVAHKMGRRWIGPRRAGTGAARVAWFAECAGDRRGGRVRQGRPRDARAFCRPAALEPGQLAGAAPALPDRRRSAQHQDRAQLRGAEAPEPGADSGVVRDAGGEAQQRAVPCVGAAVAGREHGQAADRADGAHARLAGRGIRCGADAAHARRRGAAGGGQHRCLHPADRVVAGREQRQAGECGRAARAPGR